MILIKVPSKMSNTHTMKISAELPAIAILESRSGMQVAQARMLGSMFISNSDGFAFFDGKPDAVDRKTYR